MMQVNTYKQTKNQTIDNAWTYDAYICKCHLQNDTEG